MALLLFLVALLWVVVGAGLILNTAATRRFYQDKVPADKVRTWSNLALGLGGLLVLGALVSDRWFWWPLLLGLVALGKGVFLRRAAPEQVQGLLAYWCEQAPEEVLRLVGLVLYSLGAALLGVLF